MAARDAANAARESPRADRSSETVVFIGGHWLGRCDREHGMWSCDCDEDYEAIFGLCSECGSDLDRGECSTPEEHYL